MIRSKKTKVIVATASLVVAMASCGEGDKEKNTDSDDTTTVAPITGAEAELKEVSLEDLPSISDITNSNETATALRLAVTGSSPKMVDLATTYDTALFDGVIAASVNATTITSEQRAQYEKGDALCRLTAQNADVFSSLEGGTLCYMKAIPGLSSGITLTKSSETVTQDNLDGLFAQDATKKHVQIKLSQGGVVGQIANIVIQGTDESPNSYAINFYMCEANSTGGFSPKSQEIYSVNRKTKTYTRSEKGIHVEERESGTSTFSGSSSITAALKLDTEGKLVFNLAENREISRNNSYSEGNNSGLDSQKITIDSNNKVSTLAYSTGIWGGNKGSEKIFAVSEIVGTSGDTFSMTQAGMAMERSWDYNNQTNTISFSGAAEWQDTRYAGTETSEFYNEVSTYDFAASSFFASVPVDPAVDLSDIDCAAEGDLVATWPMDDPSFSTVNATCGGDSKLRELNEICNNSAIEAARNKIFAN